MQTRSARRLPIELQQSKQRRVKQYSKLNLTPQKHALPPSKPAPVLSPTPFRPETGSVHSSLLILVSITTALIPTVMMISTYCSTTPRRFNMPSTILGIKKMKTRDLVVISSKVTHQAVKITAMTQYLHQADPSLPLTMVHKVPIFRMWILRLTWSYQLPFENILQFVYYTGKQ